MEQLIKNKLESHSPIQNSKVLRKHGFRKPLILQHVSDFVLLENPARYVGVFLTYRNNLAHHAAQPAGIQEVLVL